MSILNQIFNKATESRNGVRTPLVFIAGSILGGLGAYIFLTEKGAKLRKQLGGKANQLSEEAAGRKSLIEERLSAVQPGHSDALPERYGPDDEGSTQTLKAQNMVSHLKHKGTQEPE